MAATKEDIAELMSRLEAKIIDVKIDMIMWMFIFYTSYTLIILGGLFAFLKFSEINNTTYQPRCRKKQPIYSDNEQHV